MADTDGIIAEIVALRSPSEALIRMQDTWQLKVRETQESGNFEILNGYWRKANAHVMEVATSYDIPVARVYDAFMGDDGMQDPRDQGLLRPDGIHPNPEGSTLVAELFRELGYEYAPSAP
jgi:lysophospholipase L1-like esterase